MLNISEVMDVALGRRELEEVRRRQPDRYAGSELPPPVVVWNVCRRCNMTCPHCYAAASASESRFTLDHAEALELVDQMADNAIEVVIFSGGEPLMRDDLMTLIERADSRGLSCHLSTNGTLLDSTTARRLAAAGIGYVGVSVDGMPAFNDDYRGLEEGFEKASSGLSNARVAGLRTGLRMTLTRHNIDQLEDVFEHARALGVDRFYVSHLLDAGRGFAMSDADLSRDACRQTLRWLFEMAHPASRRESDPDIVTGGNDSDGVFLIRWLAESVGGEAAARAMRLLGLRGGNSAGVGIINIDSRGEVHPDQFWRQSTLGNVRRTSLSEILDHPLRETLANRADHVKGRCARCRFFEICGGSHRERALARHDDVWGPDPACLMTEREIEPNGREREAVS